MNTSPRLHLAPVRLAASLAVPALLVMAGLLVLGLFTACQPQPIQVFIEVDGGRQALTTDAATVREALAEARVTLGALDRVKPDLYTQLEPGLVMEVTRVREEIETHREVVPFARQTVTNEALATGETRLAQLGVNGEDEVSIRVVYENGVEVGRTEIARVTAIEPVPEILVVGPRTELPSVPVDGTIAYLSNGNAWLMRDSSGSRRMLTGEGDLDGRVFDLSPDGHYLLYTRKITDNLDLPLNELWLASTTIVGEKPVTLGVTSVLQAAWSPVVTSPLVAYTTAERTSNTPGWRAHNDIWLFNPLASGKARQPAPLLRPNTGGLYAWWGINLTWSPDGTRLAYARPDQIGIITATTSSPTPTVTTLIDFPPLKTFSEWVWVPGLAWSPDGKFIAATVHGKPLASEPVEESPIFDLWVMSADQKVAVKVVEQVGMWANPAWSETGIAFGQALNSLESADSRYSIQLIDRDGSNKRQLFPFREELGVQFPTLAWLPESTALLFSYNGNLFLVDSRGSPPRQLTGDGQASRLDWARRAAVVSETLTITGTPALTVTSPATITSTVGTPPAITPTTVITGMPGQPDRGTIPLTATATSGLVTPESPIRPTGTLTNPVSSEAGNVVGRTGP